MKLNNLSAVFSFAECTHKESQDLAESRMPLSLREIRKKTKMEGNIFKSLTNTSVKDTITYFLQYFTNLCTY